MPTTAAIDLILMARSDDSIADDDGCHQQVIVWSQKSIPTM